MKVSAVFLLMTTLTAVGQSHTTNRLTTSPTLTLVAESDNQWTGVAVADNYRLFVNFPRWTTTTPVSVAELVNGAAVPFPNKAWNSWVGAGNASQKFICVQSVLVDTRNKLWVLDAGYDLKRDSCIGARLFVFDILSTRLEREYTFSQAVVPGASYLNDFRLHDQANVAFITDSGLGGLVVLDLIDGTARRILAGHPSTLTERTQISIEGYVRSHPVHSDGIALSHDNQHLYYCALMGQYVYRIPVAALLNKALSEKELGTQVANVASTGANDGIATDETNNLYLTSLEQNAISCITPDGTVSVVVQSDEIRWPDSIAFDRQGALYFTTSQIHLPREKRGRYKLFKLELR